jgi:peptidyl-prolyl isomerase H (cyclophilin H)
MGDEVQWHAREPVASNPVVFFDVTIGGADAGRIKMELFADVCPKTGREV